MSFIFQVSTLQDVPQLKRQQIEANVHGIPKKCCEDEVFAVIIESSLGTFEISASKENRFCKVANQFCHIVGWPKSKTRFILDGERLRDDLTLIENEVSNMSVIDAFEEMIGGKGPDDEEKKILQMLEQCDSESETASESDSGDMSDSDEEKDLKEDYYGWYKELKIKLREGTLKLDIAKEKDKKLLFLLQTDSLQPYELIRLRNVYAFWEQSKSWEGISQISTAKTEKKKEAKTETHIKVPKQKRSLHDEQVDPEVEATPKKRKRLLKAFDLKTPSPLMKRKEVTETDMKQLSVSVHLWAERKMGGIDFLKKVRLNDSHFEDILQFTGPESKWNLMKKMNVTQIRKLWRNSFGREEFYRGHRETGFETESHMHSSIDNYCPFGHCTASLMSPMHLDLIFLTPKRNKSMNSGPPKNLPGRKLFVDHRGETDFTELDEDIIYTEKLSKDEPVEIPSTKVCTDDEETAAAKEGEIQSTSPKETLNENASLNQNMPGSSTDDGTHFICKICEKIFLTFSGFERHNFDKHNMKEKIESECPYCDKKVIYLDQHMRSKHSKLQKSTVCEICLQDIKFNMQRHRKNCKRCRYCDYENEKKARLLNHIQKCDKNTGEPVLDYQDEPLDLRSPLKAPANSEKDRNMKDSTEYKSISNELVTEELVHWDGSKKREDKRSKKFEEGRTKVDAIDDLAKARRKYPFDKETNDEDYYSEIEVDDTEDVTIERRNKKDSLELRLREVDGLQNAEIEGDNILVEKFKEFMRNKHRKENKEEGFSKQTEPTTILLYSDVVRKDILRAFHKLVSPFDARWLIDCKTPKICKFEGEERMHVKPEEPFYMTSRILQEALQSTQTQKKRVIAAFNQLMEFIELHFTLKLNAFGVDVLKKVMTYHSGVKSFIKGTSQWKISKDEEKESHEKKKLLKNYQNPNKDMEILEEYKKYIKSDERNLKIGKLLSYANPGAEPPPAVVMTELGISVMEEIVACTGCRPKVVRHLKMGSYIDARPGFNPHDINGEDATLEEEVDGEEIWRRVDPNLPPKERACIHQLETKSSHCSENCVNQCIPEGYNFWITWDKTQSTKGPYFLHIPTPIKNIMDRYDIVRSNFFHDKRPRFAVEDTWLEEEDTPFFLNSGCNSFPFLDLKKLSEVFGIDITAYSFRKIVCTWALNHKSFEIREAEEEALQHSLQVAKERYMLNKQTVPQNLVQTYSKESNLFPETFRKQINSGKTGIDAVIAGRQEKRAKLRHSKLIEQNKESKKIKFVNRPLGLRNTILESDRREIVEICEQITGSSLDLVLNNFKPVQWRNFIVRLVCSSTGEEGERLRDFWVKLYRGDLLFGIRDVRFKAKEENWPLRKQNPGRKDRNSWIAHALRKSCLAAQKFEDDEK